MNRLTKLYLLALSACSMLLLNSCLKQDAEACFSTNLSNCLPGNCTIGFNAFCSEGEIDTYEWDFGDGGEGEGATINHTYTQPGTYTVTLSVFGPNINSHVTTRTVTVPDSVDVTACFAVDSTECGAGLCTAYLNRACATGGDTYVWDFGDGTTFSQDANTASKIAYEYDGPGTYTITLIAISNLGPQDTAAQTITLTSPGNPGPSPNPGPTPSHATACGVLDDIVCNTSQCVAYFDASCSQNAQRFLWDFGNGHTATGQYTSHGYTQSGTYLIKLFAFDQNGDPDETSFTIDVPAPSPRIVPTACFTIDSSNCQPGNCLYEFDASCSQNGVEYTWDLGDGNIKMGAAIAHAYTAGGTYFVTLFATSQDNVIDDTTMVITISAGPFLPPTQPVACFTVDYSDCDSTFCSLGLHAACSQHATAFLWDFGDGQTGGSPFEAHSYTSSGPVDIKLTVFDSYNQSDDTTITVIIP